jgi:hypothetical protein
MVINTKENLHTKQSSFALIKTSNIAGLSKSCDIISLNIPFPGNLASQYSQPKGPGILSLQETQQ